MVTKRTPTKKQPPRRRRKAAMKDPTLWEDLAAIGRRIPDDVVDRMPKDLGRNLRHYMYGKPKTD
jgi:hypothetical protein